MSFLLFSSCWKKQDIAINPPDHPVYTLSGTVTYEDTSLPVVGGEVSVKMTELYQGDFLDSLGTITNQSGYYEIYELFRGRYDIMVMVGLDTLFLSEVGIIKYEDKEFNIIIAPDSTDSE